MLPFSLNKLNHLQITNHRYPSQSAELTSNDLRGDF